MTKSKQDDHKKLKLKILDDCYRQLFEMKHVGRTDHCPNFGYLDDRLDLRSFPVAYDRPPNVVRPVAFYSPSASSLDVNYFPNASRSPVVGHLDRHADRLADVQ